MIIRALVLGREKLGKVKIPSFVSFVEALRVCHNLSKKKVFFDNQVSSLSGSTRKKYCFPKYLGDVCVWKT